MKREYYADSIATFRTASPAEILGQLVIGSGGFAIEQTQRDAWLEQINILKQVLSNRVGQIYFEYAIPRMGKRIDVVLLIGSVIFVLEFKVGERDFTSSALDQVCDYALDLKNWRPNFELEPTDHPLSQEYHNGITAERVKEIMMSRLLANE
jgi:hypothetical protein